MSVGFLMYGFHPLKMTIFRAMQVFHLPLLKAIFKGEMNSEIKNLPSYSVFQGGVKCLELQMHAQVEKKAQKVPNLSTFIGLTEPSLSMVRFFMFVKS